MLKKVIIIPLVLMLLLTPGCTQKKDLRSDLETNREFWIYLGDQGIPNLDYAKRVTLSYTILASRTDENPVDAMVKWRKDMKDTSYPVVVSELQSKGLNLDDARLLADSLKGFDADWNKFITYMAYVDEYVRTRMGYGDIPPRQTNIKLTFRSSKGIGGSYDMALGQSGGIVDLSGEGTMEKTGGSYEH